MITRLRSMFYRSVALVLAGLLVWSSSSTALAALTVNVPAGTAVILRLPQELTSETAETGQMVQLLVDNDVVVEGKVVVKRGASAMGQVIKAKKAGAVGAAGELMISVQTVPAVDSTVIPVNFTKSAEGQSKLGTSVVLTVICCILFLLKKGENVKLPANSLFSTISIAPVSVHVSQP